MASGKTVTLQLKDLLRDSSTTATSIALPTAVHYRLDVLASLAGAMRASRAEIVAALIADAALDEDSIEQKVFAYRKKTVGDVLPQEPREGVVRHEGDNVVDLPVREPGRPRNAAS
jgi:hypothetical protein